ncbi:MAG: SRPBCC family protein [Verrucomicrobia bacterium]|nr:SRPBCC family protein [Verrucomicrobiota bacterium]
MPTATESIVIAVPPQKVFEYIADAKRATTFIPGLNRISNLSTPTAKVGQEWEFEFDWFGLIISGKSKCSRLEPPGLYQFQTVTGSLSTWTYRFQPEGSQTRVALEVEYEVPQNLLARFAAQPVLEKMNQSRARETLANLKALVES